MREFTIDGVRYREIGGDIEDGSLVVITRFNYRDIDPVVRTVVDNKRKDGMPYLNAGVDGGGTILIAFDCESDNFFVVEKVETESELSEINVKLVDKSTYTFRADSSTMDDCFIKFDDGVGNVVAQFPISKVMSVIAVKEVDVYEHD